MLCLNGLICLLASDSRHSSSSYQFHGIQYIMPTMPYFYQHYLRDAYIMLIVEHISHFLHLHCWHGLMYIKTCKYGTDLEICLWLFYVFIFILSSRVYLLHVIIKGLWHCLSTLSLSFSMLFIDKMMYCN